MIRSVPRARHLSIVPSRGLGSARAPSQNRCYSNYDSTLKNLKIGSHTRVIFQGFTGRQATVNARESIEWGTNIVGGVTPGREGEHLGLPVLPSVRKAMEILKPDATGIYVAAEHAAGAIEEAIEAEVPLIVAVAEHIPLHSMLRIHSILKTQSTCRLVGANSPGIMSIAGKCRIGFQPLPCFKPGRVGIIARSGTLSYEAAASTLRSGLGQSMCIGVGGDILPGTSLKEGLQILAEDDDTEAIALIGEIGGYGELEAAHWIRDYQHRTRNPKPIAALIAGLRTDHEGTMGHAGALTLPNEPSVPLKMVLLEAAGVAIVNHPSRFGPVLKSMLAGLWPAKAVGLVQKPISSYRRMNTSDNQYVPTNQVENQTKPPSRRQHNSISQDLLRSRGIAVTESNHPNELKRIAITINRATKNPCVVAFRYIGASSNTKRFDFSYGPSGAQDIHTSDIARHLELDSNCVNSLHEILRQFTALFAEQQGVLMEAGIVENRETGTVDVGTLDFSYDEASRLSKNVSHDGIVYIPLGDDKANIGTLVNGAGLAMNTVDALADAGGHAANFLDTGGKATSQTVKDSFAKILSDTRVKCIFVNIFGGLTRGDMIAEGILMAFRDLKMSIPVVVRIRGTNEKEGQKIIADSGLPLFAFDDFDEAAAKAIELANGKRDL
ncbi:succinyl-CoA ligase alpha-chain [Hypomontagnella monticulosa]|nr:succinyl-CoA ligase alpha-chain [Hypomontagnella monticulosa]